VKLFLSHIAEEAAIAIALKAELEKALPVSVFVSSAEFRPGQPWYMQLDDAMRGAKLVLVLCSPVSVQQPWILFESGAGWGKSGEVIPICHAGMRTEDLSLPLKNFEGVDLDSPAACRQLVRGLASQFHLEVRPEFDPQAMFDAVAPPLPQRQNIVGIDVAHGQSKWGRGSIFERSGVRLLRKRDDLLSRDLYELSGLIVGMPFNPLMDADVASAIERWVHAGGRLLLLGYELGDRHHGGNLNELSRRFGIHGNTDIVGPADFRGTKPYNKPVKCVYVQEKLEPVELTNVQTLSVEPGGVEWLRAGPNHVFRPSFNSVEYREGRLLQPSGASFDREVDASRAVSVTAPRGLCGDGRVHAVGTWMLSAEYTETLLRWLATGEWRTPRVRPPS